MAMADPSSVLSSPPITPQVDENALGRSQSAAFKDLNDSKAELLARVQSLRKDLKDWRGRLDNQVQTYKQELGELRNTLDVEVEQLKTDFQELRLSLKKQLDVTAKITESIPDKLPSPVKFTLDEETALKSVDPIVKDAEDEEDDMDESLSPQRAEASPNSERLED